jgi:hydroxymethylpyrimidine pyrophosphatase-like HAD family hydrolase
MSAGENTEGPVLVACDLDRTLIYSGRAALVPAGQALPLICVELYDENMQSFMTATALDKLNELAQQCVFVPSTTRTKEQLLRINFPNLPLSRYQVAANGGVILVDGAVDRAWRTHIQDQVREGAAPMKEVWTYLKTFRDPTWMLRLRRAEDLFCFAVVDRATMPVEVLAAMTAWTAARGWKTSIQGRKVYFVPEVLQKSAAVAEVARRVGARRILAAGDSLLDVPILELADRGVRPGHGELAQTGWRADHITTLTQRGVLAGEAIVDWLLAEVKG